MAKPGCSPFRGLIAAEGAPLLLTGLPAVRRSGEIIRRTGDPGRAVRRGLGLAQLGGVVQAHAVQNLPLLRPELPQKVPALAAVASALPAGAVDQFSDVVQQAAEAYLQGFFSQEIMPPLVLSCPLPG